MEKPGPQAPERVGQLPALEGRAVAQRAGLLRQNRHVVPRIVGDLAAPEAAGMLGDDLAVLADDDPIGIGPHVHRPPHRACRDAVLVVVEAHQTGLGNRYLSGMEAVEGAAVRHQEGRSSSNTCRTVLPGIVGCGRFLASSINRSISHALISA